MSRNPLSARVQTMRAATGLWSATINPDHGLKESPRARFTFGHLSEADARRSASAICEAIGRVAVAASVALAMLATVPSADAAERVTVRAHGATWHCHTATDCAALLESLHCERAFRIGRAVVAMCDASGRARHSA